MNIEPTKMTTTHHQNPSQFLEQANETQQHDEESSFKGRCSARVDEVAKEGKVRGFEKLMEEDNGRERLKKHRIEMGKSKVWIPDIWGQEELLKDWIDCSAFDDCLVPNGIMLAREALVEEGRRTGSGRVRIENRC
ncbi:hypothetical protein E1A91_A01G223500v1 [Gossypium mustelinum]|uniref:Protein BIC1 n=1 Tax=Gossypium mustelinum TaxID=34275 RepID=A0A5D3AIV7_GOSMU|nr:hypothetical protein E1A91_A01G223500v1 [Gossypium mustelinum]